MEPDLAGSDSEYQRFLIDLKNRIQCAQARAALSVNRELVLLYWQIGRDILSRQEHQGWGAQVIDRLSTDLRHEFPEMRGFSVRNLRYMRAFAEAWPEEAIVQQVVAQLPWGHNVRLLDTVKTRPEREWYARACLQHGWSRNVLIHQIESGFYLRQGKAITNFDHALSAPQNELARQVLKDPYNFDFLSLGPEAQERDLERALLACIRSLLLELGAGFALVGDQYHLAVGEQDFYLDLLFYHLHLRCFIVVDLKVGEFQPEHVGKMNFYLSAVDEQLRHPDDQPSIGLILCKTRDRLIAEYSLRDLRKAVGVARYELTRAVPERLRGQLPPIEELETRLGPVEGRIAVSDHGTPPAGQPPEPPGQSGEDRKL